MTLSLPLLTLTLTTMATWPRVLALSPELDLDAPPPTEPLLLAGRQFNLDFAGGEFTCHGTPIIVRETSNSGLGTGLTVWDGSLVLAKHLEARHATMAGLTVLELGCGPALAGLTAAALGADAILTDLEYALDGVRAAALVNAGSLRGRVDVAELDWTAPAASSIATRARAADWVIASDVVWVEELIAPLAHTLGWLASRPGAAPKILIAHQSRTQRSDAAFARELAAVGLKARPLPRNEHHPTFSANNIELLLVERSRDGGEVGAV
jgi:hypothetical protein